MLNILIIDDEEIYRKELGEFLLKKKFNVLKAENPSQAFEILKINDIDIVILDLNLPQMHGLEVLNLIKMDYPETEVIIITGYGDMDSVIKALRNGASDFFKKPFELMDIYAAIERTKKFINLENKLKNVETAFAKLSLNKPQDSFNFVGKSDAIKQIIHDIEKISKTNNTSVLILGETGTGKELVARAIHHLSSRKNKIFYPVNCGAIPEDIFESEFFGYKKGAFTGAISNNPGILEISNGGTLFLDEVTELTLRQQGKLLRVLEDRVIRRVGSHREIPINIRIISATNNILEEIMNNNLLREDFYYRINSFVIKIPPLRERKEDIPLLVNYFIEQFQKELNKQIKKIDEDVYKILQSYDFPGNVRELKNIIENALIISEGDILKANYLHLQTYIKGKDETKIYNLELLEKKTILEVLEITRYRKNKAAKLLNISRQSLDRRLEKYGIEI